MVSFCPLNRVVGPLPNGRTSWLINGGDPNHLLSGMILQVPTQSLTVPVGMFGVFFLLSFWASVTFQGRAVKLRGCIFSHGGLRGGFWLGWPFFWGILGDLTSHALDTESVT